MPIARPTMDSLGGLANLPAEWLAEQACVSVRSARRWKQTGLAPRGLVRLLRLLIDGSLGALARDWDGWRLHRGQLESPDGHSFTPGEVNAIPLRMQQVRVLETDYQRARVDLAAALAELERARQQQLDATAPTLGELRERYERIAAELTRGL